MLQNFTLLIIWMHSNQVEWQHNLYLIIYCEEGDADGLTRPVQLPSSYGWDWKGTALENPGKPCKT